MWCLLVKQLVSRLLKPRLVKLTQDKPYGRKEEIAKVKMQCKARDANARLLTPEQDKPYVKEAADCFFKRRMQFSRYAVG